MNRCLTITQKIDRAVTGLNGSLFVHVDHGQGKVLRIRFSEKGKDNSTLDRILDALGTAVTDIVREVQ